MANPLSIGLSGILANQTAIGVVGNNLANMNTKGYKASSAAFADLMAQANTGTAQLQVGAGVSASGTVRAFLQGGLISTGAYLDAAIQGGGFFTVKNPIGQTLYTRTGNFILDMTGKLTTLGGEAVQGWTGAGLTDIVVSSDPIPAKKTTNLSLGLNLNAASPQQFTAPFEIYTASGKVIDASIVFTPATGTQGESVANQWKYSISSRSADSSLAAGELTFNQDGTLASPQGPVPFEVPLGGGATQFVTWNLTGTNESGSVVPALTQLALPTKLSSVQQDGSPASEFVRAKIADGGKVMAEYADGREIQMAVLALGNLINPDSLIAVGNNNLMTSSDSAAVVAGASGEKGLGLVLGSTLEASTVDLATELTSMMTYQRGFQASSRVITTADELMQETLTLVR